MVFIPKTSQEDIVEKQPETVPKEAAEVLVRELHSLEKWADNAQTWNKPQVLGCGNCARAATRVLAEYRRLTAPPKPAPRTGQPFMKTRTGTIAAYVGKSSGRHTLQISVADDAFEDEWKAIEEPEVGDE
jgi:hypothetical protein